MNRLLFSVIFIVFAFFSNAFSLELRPLVQATYAPNTKKLQTTVTKNEDGVLSERKSKTDLIFEGGSELYFSAEYATMRYGFGVAYKTPQKSGDEELVPASIPFWGTITFGNVMVDRFFSPYLAIRLGSIAPITSDGNWWERPFHFLINPGVGVIFPYGIGLELNYCYTSMQKSFETKKMKFRVNSHRFGAQLSIGFELIRDRIYRSEEQQKRKRVFEESYEFESDTDDDIIDYTKESAPQPETEAPAPAPVEEPDPLMSSYPEPQPEPEPAATSTSTDEDVTIVPIDQVQKKKATKKPAAKKAPAKKAAPKKTKRTTKKR